jgi:hypothetical protein
LNLNLNFLFKVQWTMCGYSWTTGETFSKKLVSGIIRRRRYAGTCQSFTMDTTSNNATCHYCSLCMHPTSQHFVYH